MLGLTEDNADLLWYPGHTPAPGSPLARAQAADSRASQRLELARAELTALRPRYLRVLVDWAALQPDPARAPALEKRVSGCARTVAPCVAYAGIREELAAIASQQRAASELGGGAFEVVLVIFGAPAWAARAPSGCETSASSASSRGLTAAGLAGYRALIGDLLALGAREGVALDWWSPWNEPNDPVFLSPQRSACSASASALSPATYAELVRALAGELRAAGRQRHVLLGELNAFQDDAPDHVSVAQFIAALPADVLCAGDVWAIHAYAARGASAPGTDPVAALESALDKRGGCTNSAQIWVTEAGAGAPHPGDARRGGVSDERAGCVVLAGQLAAWQRDPRVRAVFQYTFREDPAYPVGLVGAALDHVYPAYRLWLEWSRALAARGPPPRAKTACA